jgi:putative transposase
VRGGGPAARHHYRHQAPPRPRSTATRPAPPNKLTDTEMGQILDMLRSERFVDLSPAQVFHILLDEGTYLASVSSYYRLLRANGETRERRRQATHPPRVRPELVACRPLVVWSWDITKLKGPKKASTTTSTWCWTSSVATSSPGAWPRPSLEASSSARPCSTRTRHRL